MWFQSNVLKYVIPFILILCSASNLAKATTAALLASEVTSTSSNLIGTWEKLSSRPNVTELETYIFSPPNHMQYVFKLLEAGSEEAKIVRDIEFEIALHPADTRR